MAKPLVFMMGRSPAFVPVDRVYARNHMWAMKHEGAYRFGFAAYAVRLLGDVRHLEWSIREGDDVTPGMPVGYVEASKATSDLFSPIAGRVEAIHAETQQNPARINTNPYDTGWLFQLTGDGQKLLSPEEYVAHLEATWPLAQQLLKGQVSGRVAERDRPN